MLRSQFAIKPQKTHERNFYEDLTGKSKVTGKRLSTNIETF